MTRRLIPYSWSDRILAAIAGLHLYPIWYSWAHGRYLSTSLFVASSIVLAYLAYWIQDLPPADQVDEYAATIARVGEMKTVIAQLSRFLEREHRHVATVKATVEQLHEQKQKLEPLVAAQRQTVDAVLAAYGDQLRRSVWKERIVAFVFGIVASVLASYLYEMLKMLKR